VNWKEFGYLVIGILALNIIGLAGGELARWGMLLMFVGAVFAVAKLSSRRWERRVHRLKSSSQAELDAELAGLDEDERRVVRLHLGHVSIADGRVDPVVGEEFAYKQTPRGLRVITLIGSLMLAGLPMMLLILGQVAEDQRVWAALVGIGFSISALVQPRWWIAEDTRIVVSPSGVQQLRPDGSRYGLLWSEIVYLHHRPWLSAIDLVPATSRRRLRIWYTLRGLPRLMELLAANLKQFEKEPV
jgi:hypothetical protein